MNIGPESEAIYIEPIDDDQVVPDEERLVDVDEHRDLEPVAD